MNFDNGLSILRRISPPRQLEDRLDAEGRLIAIETGSGRDARTVLHVDDAIPWDDEVLALAIVGRATDSGNVGGCTDGWSVLDREGRILTQYTSLARAEEAVKRAKVEVRTEFDVELDEETPAKADKAKAAA